MDVVRQYLPADDCTCELCTKLRVSIFTAKLLPGSKLEAIQLTKVQVNHWLKAREGSISLCQEKNPKSKI